MKTTNAGQNWTSVALDTSQQTFAPEILDFHIRADQPNAYYASCWYGEIYKSVDGGDTWYAVNTELGWDDNLYGIYFIDEQTGWAVGANGLILRTTTGGELTSVAEPDESIHIQVFPNPATQTLRIEAAAEIEIQNIELIDAVGRTVKTFSNPGSTIDVGDLPAGNYFLKFETNQESTIQKVMVID